MEIVVQNLKKVYQRKITALQDVNLSIGTGMFGLLGPNGAGKTTFIRILATLIRPTDGFVTVNGYRTDHEQEKWLVRAMLGYLPQELALYNDLSAYEFLEFIAALKDIPIRERRQQLQYVLEVTALTEVAKRRLKTFSGGMKRRVGVAQALLGNPQLLIVDEPTVGLDPQERVRFRNLLTRMAKERTIILSTHIIEDVAQTCSELAILYQGRLLFNDTVSTLLTVVHNKVWEFESSNYDHEPHSILVSTIETTQTTKYRVLADQQPNAVAKQVTPTLEDAYLWYTNK
ncbi:MAG: ABC transporter ATP-binding protein [Chloroflexi bacterium AL-W]|nr:ABC transporter ATP-binding protein [Chloroflexi bacterium AL-N1]NOK71402.1 ABC transporter ATP-binding protein [Chloroflexi bacterium AL-N10]NOK78805.1 ABC transporter ATP-binding protein [Chloroflexi bacterium AL-N5]NOK86223.1 ABC transporter ATP-binding protein [Chloroflexi bacterium AL-W]NOK93127.1 ABC transporter ATP-binding protein [Chloroflexi bacterium AL-N15]